MESSILGTTAAVPLARPSLLRRVAGVAMLRAETYRAIGFAGAPAILLGSGFLVVEIGSGMLGDVAVGAVLAAVGCWLLAAVVVAVRAAMGFGFVRAVAATLVGGAGAALFVWVIAIAFEFLTLWVLVSNAAGKPS